MIYGKLPVVFLSTIASEKKDNTNSQIAAYLLDHLEESRSMGIRDLAEACSVSVSSLSRFCREIGLRDFAELKELLLTSDLHFQTSGDRQSPGDMAREYGELVTASIRQAQETVDIRAISRLCGELKKYRRTAVFGLLKAGAVALNLQGDLLMLGKQVYTNISYSQQMQYLLSASEEDLILIFSYTGSYFDYQELTYSERKRLSAPRIWMVCGSDRTLPPFVDQAIRFRSRQDQISHPYQLQFVAGLIAQEYRAIQ